MKQLINLLLITISFNSFGQIQGQWHTSFTIGGRSNRMDLKITPQKADTLVTLVDPDAKTPKEYPMEQVQLTDTTISFKWTGIGLSFKGKYSEVGDSLYGVMTQSDVKWGVTFFRQEQLKKQIHRPQEPKEPFAYPVEEILIKNGDITLAATLTLPQNAEENYPIVVLASGSGPQDRDCELMGHKSFLVIADYLARNGIGCLRFDDRGVGGSTGSYTEASLFDFGSDVKACVNILAKDPRFKGHPIGIAGHSEGGMHAMIAARGNKQVKFIIELASVGTSGEAVLVEQQYLIPLQTGKTEEYAQWNSNVYKGACSIIKENSQAKAVQPLTVFLDSMFAIAPVEFKEQNNLMNFKLGILMLMNNTWGREFISFQSEEYLKRLKIPILAVNGSKDIQAPPHSNQDGFSKNFSKRSRAYSKALVVDGYNHLLQLCNTCTVLEYGELEETFSEEVLILMRDWIKKVSA